MRIMKPILWMLGGAAVLFVIAGIVGQVGTTPNRNEISSAVSKIWDTCEVQYNPQRQSTQFVECVDRLGGAYVEGVKAGRR